jgi:CIC family chloride channel protein
MADVQSREGKVYGPFGFLLLSVLVGVVSGLCAVAFRGLIAFFHNLFFLGRLSFFYDANVHTPASPWGPFVVLVPVAGAIGVAFLVKNFAPEAKGTGVPEVIDAIHYRKGIIRPVVALVKSVASALSIGSGGSVGREGPIMQISSAIASMLGRLLRMSPRELIILIAAGTGGGVAATFNTPVGGVLFAIEILIHELSVKTLVPVTVSTVVATYIGRTFFGDHPSFVIPQSETLYFHLTDPAVLLGYAVLGGILGIASLLFIRSVYGFEDFFDKWIKGGYYVRHMAGMLLVGVIMYFLMTSYGHYYIEGVGYSTIQELLSGNAFPVYLLLLLFALKLLVTSLTLGSGGSGGIFSPTLFLGATLGGAYGMLLRMLLPGHAVSPPAFAVAGMAGMLGGTTGAAMASIFMIFEMTLDYGVILPMAITVALSYGVRKLFSADSIYTLKLARRGLHVPQALQADFFRTRCAGEIMDIRFGFAHASNTVAEFAARNLRGEAAGENFLVTGDDGRILGVVTSDSVYAAIGRGKGRETLGDIAGKDFLRVTEGTSLQAVLTAMHAEPAAWILVVADGSSPGADAARGFITRDRLADFIAEAAEQVSI